jgi:glutathione S-transferase
MEIHKLAQGRYVHWGAHCSLYTGKTRSYLIKKAIDHVEISPSHPHFVERVVPQIGYFTVPVLETPEGEIIQDSTEIIEYLEAHHPAPSMVPDDMVLRALAWLIHNYGTDGLLTPAMHYRWSYVEANYDFVIDEFTRSFVPYDQRKDPISAAAAKAQAIDFGKGMDAYLKKLGVTEETIAVIEQSTESLLTLLNEHFNEYPYLLGGRPSIADFGMMAGLFAHLSRDPYSSQLMKSSAPALYRWTETMNRPGVTDPELWHVTPQFFTVDQIPETLMAVLQLICSDYGAELEATAEAFNRWLHADSQRPAGTLVALDGEKAIRQTLGEIQYRQQGFTITRTGWADPLLTHQRVIDTANSMTEAERQLYSAVLLQAGGESILKIKFERRVTRSNYAAVLA